MPKINKNGKNNRFQVFETCFKNSCPLICQMIVYITLVVVYNLVNRDLVNLNLVNCN